MKTGVYQVNAAVNDTASDALYQSAVRRFAEDLEKMEQGEEWLNSAIWRDEAVTGRVVRINREWIGTVLPLFTDAHLNGTAVDPKRLTTILTELTQLQQYLEKKPHGTDELPAVDSACVHYACGGKSLCDHGPAAALGDPSHGSPAARD